MLQNVVGARAFENMNVALLAGVSIWYPVQAVSMAATVVQQEVSPEGLLGRTTVASWKVRLKGPRPVAVKAAVTV